MLTRWTLGVAVMSPFFFAVPSAAEPADAATAPVSPAAQPSPASPLTALDRYVARPDDTFAWKQVARRDGDDATTLVIELTSQTWRTPEEVDRYVWKHWMSIICPKGASSSTAMLLIGGGANAETPPDSPSDRGRAVAVATRSVVVELGQVPNQPIVFRNDGQEREEDDLVAQSWVECLKTGDTDWVAQLPMTKSAVRAMDAAQAAVVAAGFDPIEKFVVAGGSKRGWTTWLTAAVDPRVIAIAPVVIDVVNVRPSMLNHHAAYGFWSEALDDYQSHGLTLLFNSPLASGLFSVVDPYAYRARLTLPKCVINATGDQFFTPDSSKFYFDDLVGEKLLYYVPNANHSLDGTTALDTLIAFYASVLNDLPRPKVSWRLDDAGAWHVRCEPAPQRARAWRAVNEQARDFRVHTLGKAFAATELEPDASGEFVAPAPTPPKGWAANLVELEFDIGAPTPLRISTPVHITPDTLPFAK